MRSILNNFKQLPTNRKIVILLVIIIAVGLYIMNQLLEPPRSQIRNGEIIPQEDIYEGIQYEVVNISPPSGEQQIIAPNKSIQITFSVPINEQTVFVTSDPFIDLEFYTADDGKTLHIKPLTKWEFSKKYIITINVESYRNEELPEPIDYEFFATFPSNIPAIE